jgi:hypothetical protein
MKMPAALMTMLAPQLDVVLASFQQFAVRVVSPLLGHVVEGCFRK